jgi:hypothetical protein
MVVIHTSSLLHSVDILLALLRGQSEASLLMAIGYNSRRARHGRSDLASRALPSVRFPIDTPAIRNGANSLKLKDRCGF